MIGNCTCGTAFFDGKSVYDLSGRELGSIY
jgi:hypothetical protein